MKNKAAQNIIPSAAKYSHDDNFILFLLLHLTHISLASLFEDIGKQCRARSDAAERGV